jgi:hypothetical protein
VKLKARGSDPRVKKPYVRRPGTRPSDISLCPTARGRAVGHKLMSDGQSDSRRLFSVIFDGRCWPSDIIRPSEFYSFTVVLDDDDEEQGEHVPMTTACSLLHPSHSA